MGYIKECPKNEAEVIKSSNTLKCGTDDYGNNQYICVPNKDKSSLVELCYNGTMGLREKGNCVEESGGRLISYNCSKFRTGCPGENFDLNTIYKYPACQMINTELRCYVMDPSCKPGESIKGNDGTILYLLLGSLVAVLIIAVIILYLTREEDCDDCCNKDKSKQQPKQEGENDSLLPTDKSKQQPKQEDKSKQQPKQEGENDSLLPTDKSKQPPKETDKSKQQPKQEGENDSLLPTDKSKQPPKEKGENDSLLPTDKSKQPPKEKDKSKQQPKQEEVPMLTKSGQQGLL